MAIDNAVAQYLLLQHSVTDALQSCERHLVMTLADLTDPAAVEIALNEFDRLGREAFLAKYEFGPARRYFLVRSGKRYDSKAIAAVAHGYQHPQLGPLALSAFSWGDRTVRSRLELLGFRVVVDPGPADRQYWALVANPTIYRIEEAVRELTQDPWTIKGRPLAMGDWVLIWKARGGDETRGVVAFGEVLSDPELMTATEASDATYWAHLPVPDIAEERVWIRYVTAPHLPLWVDGPADAVLRDLSVERARGGTVFRIEPDQWSALVEAAGGLPDDAPEVQVARQTIKKLARAPVKGQGFAGSIEERQHVEQHAMSVVTAHFAALGWTVHDVSATHSYDLRCVDNN